VSKRATWAIHINSAVTLQYGECILGLEPGGKAMDTASKKNMNLLQYDCNDPDAKVRYFEVISGNKK